MSSPESAVLEASPDPVPPVRRGYWHDHVGELPRRLLDEIPSEELRVFHERSAARHFLVVAQQLAIFALCLWGTIRFDEPWIWIPFAALQGIVILSFIILLHEVVHATVFKTRRPAWLRFLGLAYAAPSAISASQFTRWHLDHHKQLGSSEDDPKRAHLSPKRNARWYKALYMTAALFAIYWRAAGTESKKYEAALKRRIAMERVGNLLLHAAFVAALWHWFGLWTVVKAYVVPLFVFFPPAFTLNRLGQHYWVDASDPAKWSTRVDGSPLVRFLFLNSNHHVEHHYFPSVPLYKLTKLNRRLRPFWERIGHANRSYPSLVWGWFVKNGAPHSDWTDLA